MMLNKKKRFLSDMLKDANNAVDPSESLKQAYLEDPRAKKILAYCVHGGYKLANVIPDGTPPFKESDLPLGLAMYDVLCLSEKLGTLFRQDLKRFKREQMYIQWIEGMHPTDANIMNHVKDQTLHVLYPNITHEQIYKSLGWSKEQYENLKK